MKIDLLCPVENQGVIVKTSAQTEAPYALLKLFNLSDRVIESVSFVLEAYDEFGGKLGTVQVKFEELAAEPKALFAETKAISLEEFPEAKHIAVEIQEVHFAEGEPYIKKGEPVEISVALADDEEKMRLEAAAGEDAVCYAKEEGTHWVCVCGRPNVNEATTCVRCDREKETVLELFGSCEALTQTLEEQAEAERQMEEALRQEAMEAKAARMKKIKKGAIIAGISVVALLVLWFLISLVYSGVHTLMGNSAAKNSDYLAAYTHYAAANNEKKLATVSEKVMGNSPFNLTQSGILTSDQDNIYYVNNDCAIFKENRTTGEKSRLGEANGLFLNVSGEWLYYLDVISGQKIARVNVVDGTTIETVYEKQDGYILNLALVGNELYFVMQELRTDLTPAEQEQIAASGDNSAMIKTRLHRMKIGEKTAEPVSDETIAQFILYGGKIYYTNAEDTNAIYCMNRNGGDVKKLVGGPVYSYGFHKDMLFYVDATPNEETGMAKLSLMALDLESNRTDVLIQDKMVIAFNYDGDELYYIEYSPEGINLMKKANEQVEMLAGGCQQFNVRDGYLLYLNTEGKLIKTTYDKSDVETIEMPQIAEAPAAE